MAASAQPNRCSLARTRRKARIEDMSSTLFQEVRDSGDRSADPFAAPQWHAVRQEIAHASQAEHRSDLTGCAAQDREALGVLRSAHPDQARFARNVAGELQA